MSQEAVTSLQQKKYKIGDEKDFYLEKINALQAQLKLLTQENVKLRAEKKVFVEKTVHINVHEKLVSEVELL